MRLIFAVILVFTSPVLVPWTIPHVFGQTSQVGGGSSASPQETQSSSGTPTSAQPTPALQPQPNPTMSAPLETAAPAHTFNAGPFGTIAVTGILSGMMLTQDNSLPGDNATNWDVSNAQIFLQKSAGWWQFYLQGGAYNIPDLGVPFISTNKTLADFYGPLPVGYLKLVKGNFSVEAGELPTLIGAEYTFSFENTNIERGLLWNQENAINRGVQLNGTIKKLTASLSWNDGFYSNRYTWLSGSLTYAFDSAHTFSVVAGGNAGQTRYVTVATPVQNNGEIYNVIYSYSRGSWWIQPYYQHTTVPTNLKAGISRGANTRGGALLLNYNFKHGVSLALRPEYISTSGSLNNGAVNLLYGPGSNAFAFTFTPTYQKQGFFVRGDFSVVDARDFTSGDAFGRLGQDGTQTRAVVEAGFMF